MGEVVRIGGRITFYLSKLWKAKFPILCDFILLVRLQEKFEIDQAWEWKGQELLTLFSGAGPSGRQERQRE